MLIKDVVARRLRRLEVIEGVVPTIPARSEALAVAARSMRGRDIGAAERAAQVDLDVQIPQRGFEAATGLLSGSEALRQQVAGFADVGINFFFADAELLALELPARKARGASDMVSRVLISEQRILLETPRIVVRFKPGVTADVRASILKRRGVLQSGSSGLPPETLLATVTQGRAVEASLVLMEDEAVIYAEPDFIEHIGQRHTPNDPDFPRQWHHTNILAEQAWDVSRGEGVAIAVVDNAFDATHPDLAFGPMSGWFRPSPDLADADFVHGLAGMPDGDHGTACAGMIAARTGNGQGGVGVAFAAELSMIGCVGDQVGTQSTLARAIAYAASPRLESGAPAGLAGADVIVCSLGPNGAAWQIRQVLADAIDFATTQGRDGRGCAVFWACTNGNFPIGSDEVCSHPRVIAVGRSRSDDRDDGSGFGAELEYLAPGVDVVIPASGGGYQTTTGTSFAAPCAAGVAALALAQHPELTGAALRQLMRDACDKVGPIPYIQGRNTRFGHGRINARTAVDEAKRLAAIA